MISTRAPRLAWRKRREDAFPISVFRRDGKRVVHLERMHAHDFFTILVVDSGQGTVQLVGKTLSLARGDVHLLPPGEPHDTTRLADVSGWVIEFTADALGDVHGFFGAPCGRPMWIGFQPLGGLGGGRLTLGEDSLSRAQGLLRDLDRELTEQNPVYQEAARSLLRLLLILLSREATQGIDLPHRLSPLVEEVFQVIDKRYFEPISLADVARAVGRSGSYVTNLVRAQTRLTVLEWITERRLDEARRRLRETDEDVGIVAERVGYTSVDHFIRQFRRAHAMTPGQWRKALSGPV